MCILGKYCILRKQSEKTCKNTFSTMYVHCNILYIFVKGNKTLLNENIRIDFQSSDGRIVLYACDYFAFSRSVLDSEGEKAIDRVFDRGSLVAVLPEERKKYVEVRHNIGIGEHLVTFLTKKHTLIRYRDVLN